MSHGQNEELPIITVKQRNASLKKAEWKAIKARLKEVFMIFSPLIDSYFKE